MKYLFRLLSFSLMASAASQEAYSGSGADAAGVFASVRPYVVTVYSESEGIGKKTGSGVIIGPNEILSNCHVIEGASEFTIEFFDSEKLRAMPGRKVENLDLCTLIVTTGNRRPAKVASLKSMKVGQKVFALGNPLSLSATFSDGLISGLRKQDGRIVIQTTTPISPGSSGGGLFDADGRLLGITTFTLVRGQSLNFALPAEYLNTLQVSSIGGAPTREQVTFKGVPFGSSVQTFKASFPGARCVESRSRQELTGCYGQAEFLGRWGQYSVGFESGRMQSANFVWGRVVRTSTTSSNGDLVREHESTIEVVYEDLRQKLVNYFGPSTKSTQTQLQWQFGKEQAILFGYRDCVNPLFGIECSIPNEPKVIEMDLADYRFTINASPRRDF